MRPFLLALVLSAATSVAALAQPANDALSSAATLTQNINANGSNVDATTEPDEAASSCNGSAGASVWWTFTPSINTSYRVETLGSSFDTDLSVWTGSGHPLAEVACNDDAVNGQSRLVVALTAGTTYRVRVAGVGGATGSIVVRAIALPANDDFASATALSPATLPANGSSNTFYATDEANEGRPSCDAYNGVGENKSVWWSFTPTSTGHYVVTSSATASNPVLSLWTGSAHPLAEVTCSKTAAQFRPARMYARMTAGTTYYIRAVPGHVFGDGPVSVSINTYTPESNDDLASALVLAEDVPAVFTTRGALKEANEAEAECASFGHPSSPSMWYTFTPAATSIYKIEATQAVESLVSDIRPTVVVATGATHPLTEVGCAVGTRTATAILELTAGTTYRIRVSGEHPYDVAQMSLLATNLGSAPPNDHLADATVASGPLPLTLTGSNLAATLEASEERPVSCTDLGNDASLWWSFTPAASGTYRISTAGSSINARVSLWTGTTHPLTEEGCYSADPTVVYAPLAAGVPYLLRVVGLESADRGDVELVVALEPPPANDNLASAADFGAAPATATSTVFSATAEPNEAAPSCPTGDNSVWWKFTPSSSGAYRFHTIDSDFDTVLSLWSGAGHPLTELDCNDDASGVQSQVFASLDAGTTYYLRVAGYSGSVGNVSASVEALPAATNDARANATLLEGALPITASGSTFEATAEGGEATASCAGIDARSLWFRYIPETDGTLELWIDYAGNDYSLAIYNGDTELRSECVGGMGRAFREEGVRGVKGALRVQNLFVPVAAGQTYDLRIASSDPIAFTLNADGPASLPVELVAFAATTNGRAARLAWTTASETNNAGFVVERQQGEDWTDASPLQRGHGTTTERHDYVYVVNGLTAGRHTFRLRQADTDGTIHHSDAVTVEIGVENALVVTLLGQRTVRVETGVSRRVEVSVYDVLGRRVLERTAEVSGTVDVALPPLAAGTYVVRALSEGVVLAKTLVVR